MKQLTLADIEPEYAAQHPSFELQLSFAQGAQSGKWQAFVLDQNYVLGIGTDRTEEGAARAAVRDAESNGNRRMKDGTIETKCGQGHVNQIPSRRETVGLPLTYRCTFAGCSDIFPVGNRP